MDTVKEKLNKEKPELKDKKFIFLLDDKKLDFNKTLEENQIKNKKSIVINIQKEGNNVKTNNKNKNSENNNNKEKAKGNKMENNKKINKEENKKEENKKENKGNINNDEISVTMEDEDKKKYNLKCKINDEFQSLEIELFKNNPSLKDQKINYFINQKNIDISNTIKQNNIKNGSIIYYKIDKSKNEDPEEISVIIKSMDQDFKSSFICKRTDKFKVLEEKLYERKPELKNKSLYYLYYGNSIDIEKTIEQNNIKDSGIIIYNIDLFEETI